MCPAPSNHDIPEPENADLQHDKGVAAVDRALAVLFAIEKAGKPITLTQVSHETGYYKSTVLRLLESLLSAALVSKLKDGSYVLGAAVMRLGIAFEISNPMRHQILPVLTELVDQGTESASFHVAHTGSTRLCILRVDSHHATLDRVRAGDVLPLDRGAAGRLIAAHAMSNRSSPASASVRASVTVVSIGERDPSCAGLAAPVFAAGGGLLGAISLSGPTERFEASNIEIMRPLLIDAARRLTVEFGGTFPY
jgi:DNA-binding IclR family transcriptional regulator